MLLARTQKVSAPFPQIILGLIIPGFLLTIVVLILYAYTAWHPVSRRHLDRVSFRLLVYALFAHVVFGIVFPIITLMGYPGWKCNFLAFLYNLSLMFSAGMFFCMALNLPLVLAHRVNGQRMEKYYVGGTAVVCGACSVTPYAAGRLGWDSFNQMCWYRTAPPDEMVRWLVGTQTLWILLVSVGEVVAFFTIAGYLIIYELDTRRFRDKSAHVSSAADAHTLGSTIAMFRGIVLRIGLYPLVACLLNISTAGLDVFIVNNPVWTDLTCILTLLDLAIYSARPLIYGILAATDPSFIRALHALRHPESQSHSQTQHGCLSNSARWAAPSGCLSTVVSMPPDSEVHWRAESESQWDTDAALDQELLQATPEADGDGETAVGGDAERGFGRDKKEPSEEGGAGPSGAGQRAGALRDVVYHI
ncbi:hypothetical protein FB451DRAFT_1433663 [Mycena latifolia]|nr:hypothetical protein FB451DRAFT_1433663 [Mycena latifolia]